MKRLLLALVAACSLLTAAAQQSSVCVYGIDFSLTRTAGAGECREDFAEAFRRINLLLRSEADKYDFARALRQPLVLVDIEPMLQHLSGCSYESSTTRRISLRRRILAGTLPPMRWTNRKARAS